MDVFRQRELLGGMSRLASETIRERTTAAPDDETLPTRPRLPRGLDPSGEWIPVPYVDPKALEVEAWMNTGGEALELASLKGKVVVLDFWGTW